MNGRSDSYASLVVGELKLGVAGHSIVSGLPTPLITGAVVSCTVMVWVKVLRWVQRFVSVHVRGTEKKCGQLPAVGRSGKVKLRTESHAFDARRQMKLGVGGQ